ncbi:thymidine kinase [Candidatus Woesearchaeota archaeon]|nr:thymidine kinase [Candidatus Woesearchaeota archaeon]
MHSNNLIVPGYFEIYCGPMKSGKTKMLMDRVEKLNYMNNCNFIFINPSANTRDEKIRSRCFSKDYDCIIIDKNRPADILNQVNKDTDLVAIEEAQFFEDNIGRVVEELIRQEKNVIAAGLDLNFRGEPFHPMPYLLSIADEINKLTAVCDYEGCSSLATRTQKLIKGIPAHYDSEEEYIGGSNSDLSYQARCIKHHIVPGKIHDSSFSRKPQDL